MAEKDNGIDDGSPKTISDFPMAENDLRVALEGFSVGLLRSLQICFPVCVYSYNRSTHTAEVMPLVKQAFFNGKWNYIRRKPFKVAVRNIQCGGFTIDYPVYVGDTGWVFSSDRDTLLLKQEGALTNSVLAEDRPIAIVEDDYQQRPNQPILHDFARGFFIPDNWGAWETHRFKDNPGVAIGTSLYIGSSIDTDDKRNDVDGKKYQKGDGYEKKTTSSIVMGSNGGVSIASSSPTETNQHTHVNIATKSVSMAASDDLKGRTSSVNMDAEDGIVIMQDVEKDHEWEEKIKKSDGTEEVIKHKNERHQHFICSILPGKFYLRLIDDKNMLNFSFQNGKLNVSTSSDVNMRVGGDTSFRCNGDVDFMSEGHLNINAEGEVNVRTGKEAYVSAKEARVVSEGDASIVAKNVAATASGNANVNAGNNVNIGAVKTTNINAGQKVNIAGGKDINITAPDNINIITASNATVMAKKKGAKILVTTLSKSSSIDIVAKGKDTKMNVTMEKDNSPIQVKTKGENSDISIEAAKSVMNLTAYKDLNIKSLAESVNISAAKNVTVSAGEDISLIAGGKFTVVAGGAASIGAANVDVKGSDINLDSSSLHALGANIYLNQDSNKNKLVQWN